MTTVHLWILFFKIHFSLISVCILDSLLPPDENETVEAEETGSIGNVSCQILKLCHFGLLIPKHVDSGYRVSVEERFLILLMNL